jgi:hypothetical protein
VPVELNNMTKDFGLILKILGGGEGLKHWLLANTCTLIIAMKKLQLRRRMLLNQVTAYEL